MSNEITKEEILGMNVYIYELRFSSFASSNLSPYTLARANDLKNFLSEVIYSYVYDI